MAYLYLKNKHAVCLFIVVFSFVTFFISTSFCSPYTDIVVIQNTIADNKLELENLNQYKENLLIKKEHNIKKLEIYRENITESILALYKLEYIPLASLLLNSAAYQDMAISYALFNYYTNYMNNQLNMIYEHLYVISENGKELENLEKRLIDLNNKLIANLRRLQYLNANDNKEQLAQQNKQFIKSSKDLATLVHKVANEYVLPSDALLDDQFAQNKGKFNYPVEGYFNTYFHQGNQSDIFYNGISILAPPKSLVYAPFDGEIVFVDKFPNYDNLVIIKHSASYFSIISGNFENLVSNAQLVKKQDIIGVSSADLLPIYFELQYKHKGINVMDWIEKPTKNKAK